MLSHIDRDTHLVASRVAHATYGVVCSLSAIESDGEHKKRELEWEEDPKGDRYVPWYFEPKIRKVGLVFRAVFQTPTWNVFYPRTG